MKSTCLETKLCEVRGSKHIYMHFDLKNTQEAHTEQNEVLIYFVHMVPTKDNTNNQKYEAFYNWVEIQKCENMVSHYSIQEWAFYLSNMLQLGMHMTKRTMEDFPYEEK